MESQDYKHYFIIEHFEMELSEWTLKEYTHMLMIMKGIYHEQKETPSKLILTNFKYIDDINQGKLEEDELKTLKHTQQYQSIIKNLGAEDLVMFTRYSLKDLTTV